MFRETLPGGASWTVRDIVCLQDCWRDAHEVLVPENHVFVAGDNRTEAEDSRSEEHGTVPMHDIVGYWFVTFWDAERFSFVWRTQDRAKEPVN